MIRLAPALSQKAGGGDRSSANTRRDIAGVLPALGGFRQFDAVCDVRTDRLRPEPAQQRAEEPGICGGYVPPQPRLESRDCEELRQSKACEFDECRSRSVWLASYLLPRDRHAGAYSVSAKLSQAVLEQDFRGEHQ